jgi:Domain of unknown function (DUF6048)
LATTGSAFSQEKDADSVRSEDTVKPVDTVKSRYFPTGLRLGTDVISIIKSRSGNSFSGWEANADVDFSRYYLAVDYGFWSRQVILTNGDYSNNGNYYRVGVDINFLLKDPDRNMFFIGFRYGHSAFNETVNYDYPAPFFGTIPKTISTTGLHGHWGEITTGLRVKIWTGFWMGYTARMKFAPGAKGGGALAPYDMPGYGLVDKAPYWGFNYQLFWRIPFRKAPPVPKK